MTDRRPDDDFPSPYNFVPLAEQVVQPGWGRAVSHDIPFEDGISGHLEIEIEALTPIICRGSAKTDGREDAPGEFFRDARGNPAIPGTSLRGMLRSVVEIAAFARMERVNDHFHGIRDLHNNHTYGRHMAEIQRNPRTGRQEPVALVDAGWLRKTAEDDDGNVRWTLEPCHFAKVEYDFIRQVAKAVGRPKYDPGQRRRADEKYRDWVGAAPGAPLTDAQWDFLEQPFDCRVAVLSAQGTRSKSGITRLSDYGKLVPGGGQPHRGRLVFTGQPQAYRPGEKKKKHHDFFFYGTAGHPIEVPPQVRRAFEHVHRDAGQQWRDEPKPNDEWAFWKTRLDEGGRVPVFFLRNPDGTLRAFGLAMMFRLAYDQSTRDVVRNAQPDRRDPRNPAPDLAECIFGYVHDNRREGGLVAGVDQGALRGRISVGQARLVSAERPAPEVRAVLGVPKPTFYPAYVVQGGEPGGQPPNGKPTRWSTYMSDAEAPRARGWKRYLARNQAVTRPPLPAKSNERVTSRLRPLQAGSRFRARIRVHNLRPIELGALLWALDFGGAPGALHTLGQGRPFGYGMVRLTIDPAETDLRQVTWDRPPADLDAARTAFRRYMEAQVPGWTHSVQLTELIAMATPGATDTDALRYPDLDRGEFNDIKRQARALPLHGGPEARAARARAIEADPPLRDDFPDGLDLTPPRPDREARSAPPPAATIRSVAPAPEPRAPARPPETPRAPAPAAPTPPAVLPDLILVRFADFLRAREARKNHAARLAKKKPPKPALLDLTPVDESQAAHPSLTGLKLDTTTTHGVDLIFEHLRTSNTPITFLVRPGPDAIVAEARLT